VIQLRGCRERWFAGAGSLGLDGFDGGYPPLIRAWKWPFRAAGLLDPTRFAVITKTVTRHPRVGRQTNWGFRKYAWYLRPFRQRSMVNAVALTNPGLDAWVARHYRAADRLRLVLSLSIDSEREADEMGRLCRPLTQLRGVQINAGCPNVAHDAGPDGEVAGFRRVVDAFQQHYDGPLLVKFRLGQPWKEMAAALDGRCAAYELINAVPWDVARATTAGTHDGKTAVAGESPLQRYGYGGSVSGGRIAYAATAALVRYVRLGLRTPVISGGGLVPHYSPNRHPSPRVSLADEARTRLREGAAAVAFSTAFLWQPWAPNRAAAAVGAELARSDLNPDGVKPCVSAPRPATASAPAGNSPCAF
jgi:dihydroorotate dehydrogenase